MAKPISRRDVAKAGARGSLVAAAVILLVLVVAVGLAATSRHAQAFSNAQSSAQNPSSKNANDESSPDDRARATEARMTDDERFSLLISILGNVAGGAMPPDSRVRNVRNQSAGYTPGIPRLGIAALQSSDASMGVTNPGYRPDDKGATAFPASIVVGSSFNPQFAREGGSRSHGKRAAAASTSSWPAA